MRVDSAYRLHVEAQITGLVDGSLGRWKACELGVRDVGDEVFEFVFSLAHVFCLPTFLPAKTHKYNITAKSVEGLKYLWKWRVLQVFDQSVLRLN